MGSQSQKHAHTAEDLFLAKASSFCLRGNAFQKCSWDFPGGQWLRLHSLYARGMGSIPGQGTKILHAAWHGAPKKFIFQKLS